MLIPRKLDDQRFEDIMHEAVGRLPWLCPQWTDHNAHDPGITLLELMAWYKEMQQYQMDQLTPSLRRGLLALAGVRPAPPQPAVCALEAADTQARPALSRLTSRQEVCFELLEPVTARRTALERAQIEQEGRATDVADLLSGSMELRPFLFSGQSGSALRLGFSGETGGTLRLWFDVTPPQGAARNSFDAGQDPPRDIAWTFEGAAQARPLSDETYAFSRSGYVRLAAPADWPADADGLRWLRLTLIRAGCEEQPRLCGVSDRRYQAAQQQTRARSHWFTVEAGAGQRVALEDALARTAELAVFLRTAQGLTQLEQYQEEDGAQGRTLLLDAQAAAMDGAANVLVVCLDPVRVHDLLFDTVGRPGEELYLNLDGQTVLPQRFGLLCQTLEPDGAVRPAVWHCVDDLYACGPRDRAFTYDPVRETVSFGNGRYGAMVVPGKGAVLVMDLTVSQCGMGNIPANAGLYFEDGGQPAGNTAACGGRDGESVAEAGQRLLRQLCHTEKCLSAADYEEQARRTPGLRVAAARALPDYDPQAPVGARGRAMVTVVVIPASEEKRPAPDARFLAAVNRRLEQRRTIGVRTQAIGPRYVDVDIAVQLRTNGTLDRRAVEDAMEARLSAARADIGAPVRRSDMLALVQKLPGVLEVQRLELRGAGPDAYQTAAGDIRVPPDGVAVLRRAEVEIGRI